ncbi:MAG: primosomal protein N' [Solirubrobacterales bacterium]
MSDLLVRVVLNITGIRGNEPFTYAVPSELTEQCGIGRRVRVPLGSQTVTGLIVAVDESPVFTGEIKSIAQILDEEPLVPADLTALAIWISDYYLAPLGRVIRTMVPGVFEVPGRKLAGYTKMPGEQAISQNHETTADDAPKDAEPAPAADALCQIRVADHVGEPQVQRLIKPAPRQADGLRQLLKAAGPLDERQAAALIGAAPLAALLHKGLAVKESKALTPLQDVLLNPAQSAAAAAITQAIESTRYEPFLLFGVTGSGKTEVYLRAMETARRAGKQTLMLVPEIGLTEQLITILGSRLGSMVSVLHSRLTDAERRIEWERARYGGASVVVGARSAVFAPLTRLGLVIIDEEQESSFRQDENPRYDARMVALERARQAGAALVMGSATPSLEATARADREGWKILRLPDRIADTGPREIVVADMRRETRAGNAGLLSQVLLDSIAECLRRGDQAIVFLNRRGYATLAVCLACGHMIGCRSCDVKLNYHRESGRMICHTCGYEEPFENKCPACQSRQLRLMGAGTQKIEAELLSRFPDARILRVDTDSVKARDGHRQFIDQIAGRKVDLIVGTQMIAKGFDFPGVALVGIVHADALLGMPDFRARERAFSLLLQVAGRAGRGSAPAQVILQTYDPEEPVFELLQREDYASFVRDEMTWRETYQYPPFAELVKLSFSGPDEAAVVAEAAFSRLLAEEMIGESGFEIEVLGPAPCAVTRVKNRYRHQMLLKGSSLDFMRTIARYIIEKGAGVGVRVDADIDPQGMM